MKFWQMSSVLSLASVLAVLVLSACAHGAPKDKEPSRGEVIQDRYEFCIKNGGSWKWHGNSGSWDCLKPHAVWRG